MLITYLGHAGFCVETSDTVVIMDPWLSSTGAFDSSWFQFPRNHHLGDFVRAKLSQPGKERFLYISHEHKDHFDPEFLRSLAVRDFSIVLAAFRRNAVRDALKDFLCKSVIVCSDGQPVHIPGGTFTIYVDDSELSRDSAILLHVDGAKFLNMNDCKLFDRLGAIVQEQGPIDLFGCQFSGATWHPTCYDYPRACYNEVSSDKKRRKFETVARAIETVQPKLYLPSAGPACFLDPRLFHINFEEVNIFPRAPELIEFLDRRVTDCRTKWFDLMPGDIVNGEGEVVSKVSDRVTEHTFPEYIRQYANDFASLFEQRDADARRVNAEETFRRLRDELARKLNNLPPNAVIPVVLDFALEEIRERAVRVDFPARSVQIASTGSIPERHYRLCAPAWQVKRVLDRQITWEDFALTFRVRLHRNPDTYYTLLVGFLFMEADDVAEFSHLVLGIADRQERVEIQSPGGQSYVVDRYCPHQGGDLTKGWIEGDCVLVCPRHRWRFDLSAGGRCFRNEATIHAVAQSPLSSPPSSPSCAEELQHG